MSISLSRTLKSFYTNLWRQGTVFVALERDSHTNLSQVTHAVKIKYVNIFWSNGTFATLSWMLFSFKIKVLWKVINDFYVLNVFGCNSKELCKIEIQQTLNILENFLYNIHVWLFPVQNICTYQCYWESKRII